MKIKHAIIYDDGSLYFIGETLLPYKMGITDIISSEFFEGNFIINEISVNDVYLDANLITLHDSLSIKNCDFVNFKINDIILYSSYIAVNISKQ